MSEGSEAPERCDAPPDFDPAQTPSTGSVPPTVADALERFSRCFASGESDWLTIAEVEREHIRQTLHRAFYNQCEAARLLGIERHQLARKIRKYGLDVVLGQADAPLGPDSSAPVARQTTVPRSPQPVTLLLFSAAPATFHLLRSPGGRKRANGRRPHWYRRYQPWCASYPWLSVRTRATR